MAANLNANVTISGNLTGLSTQIVSTMNVASGFAIGGSYVTGFRNTIAEGYYHTAAILNNGTVRTFGLNNNGQLGVNDTGNRLTPVQVWGISSSATAVACGWYNTAIVLADGTVRTMGLNGQGQLGVNDTPRRITPVQVWGISSSATSVACGMYFTAVLLANGTVVTFGWNNQVQLGVNDTTNRPTPVQVWGISSSAVAVACGQSHTAVLLADGTVRTFGANANGNLGVNDTTNRSTPVQVWGISSSAVAVACGQSHTAVLLADGTVRTFGRNTRGQLGVNDTTSRPTPVQVWGISSSATAIACGVYFTAVLLADGTVRTFGQNSSGQLGVNDTTSRLTPVQVWGISSSATAIACGRYSTVVLRDDGTVQTFGNNINGQLGVNDTTSRQTPVQVLNISTAFVQPGTSGIQLWTTAGGLGRKVAATQHTAVLLVDGTVRTFGRNDQGQLGVNDTTTRSTPVTVLNISTATAVTCGRQHTAALLVDGTVRTFGLNNYGQLGVNDTTTRLTPIAVLNITSATVVACGWDHTVALLAGGTVWTFGDNGFGKLGVNDTTSRQTPVQVWGISSSAIAVTGGRNFTSVLLSDGTVRTFGQNSSGQLGVNDTTSRLTPVQVWGISSSATAVAMCSYHAAVLLADGTVRTFGWNGYGQLGVNDTTSRLTPVQVWGISSSAVAVACGFQHIAILLADGTVRTFGRNDSGQLGLGDATSRLTPVQVLNITSATAIACGFYYTTVLLADGTVRTFGQNTYGQLGVNDTVSRQTPVIVFGVLGAIPYVNATCLSLGLLSPQYQLDMSTDKARKLTTTTWTTGSDQRIKTDVESANLARCVDIVDSLDLKYFKWNFPEGQQPPTDTHSLGWIAQDVKEFFPKSIRLTQDYGFEDFHNLDSDQLIKTMYGALKKMCNDTYGQ